LEGFSGSRNLSTGIYFLLDSNNFSAFHRIKSDEMWHFYEGDPLVVHMIDLEGKYLRQEIGLDIENGQLPQFVVPAGYWFASEVLEGGEYSFVGCTVSPGFDFNDFELANRNELMKTFPSHATVLHRLCRNISEPNS
jgi:predicted cupin superfamily sugar epimerase